MTSTTKGFVADNTFVHTVYKVYFVDNEKNSKYKYKRVNKIKNKNTEKSYVSESHIKIQNPSDGMHKFRFLSTVIHVQPIVTL